MMRNRAGAEAERTVEVGVALLTDTARCAVRAAAVDVRLLAVGDFVRARASPAGERRQLVHLRRAVGVDQAVFAGVAARASTSAVDVGLEVVLLLVDAG